MRKTILLLASLSGIAFSAPERGDQIWKITFGTDIDGTNDYKVVNYGDITYTPTNVWDVSGYTGKDYVSTNGDDKRVHTEWTNGCGLTWDDNFEFEIVFELPNNFSTNSNWPVLAELSGNGSSVRFGPYTQQQNKLYVDGVNITKNPVDAPLTLTTGEKHTATLTVYEGGITLKLDGQIAQTATLADTASGNIVDITLGGNKSNAYRLAENVYSISAYKVVPEPTSATLSLLALAGLAMRRRRKLA